jgi:hypothetical protein
VPGSAPVWAPSRDDLLQSPTVAVLKPVADRAPDASSGVNLFALVPERPFLFGTILGGPPAFLAMGSLAMPLGLAIVLHLVAPRGSRESLSARLSRSGQGSLVALLVVLLASGALLVGLLAGPYFALPFTVGLAVVALPAVSKPPTRWVAFALSGVVVLCLWAGVALILAWPAVLGGSPPVPPLSWRASRLLWTESLPILKDFPLVGTGLGSFPAIHPYYKIHDVTATTALSSLLQCSVESGAVGLGILGLALLWCVCRLPWCVKAVGTADRTLAYGLIATAVSFSLWSVVHWTTELPSVAISACAVGGVWNRWLAGGTDLFVERG